MFPKAKFTFLSRQIDSSQPAIISACFHEYCPHYDQRYLSLVKQFILCVSHKKLVVKKYVCVLFFFSQKKQQKKHFSFGEEARQNCEFKSFRVVKQKQI
jgi:hypothetical protein